MNCLRVCACVVILWAATAVAGEFGQFRGPDRSGVAADAAFAPWGQDGPTKLWESEEIPGGNDGGFSCVSVAGGKAYVFVNDKYQIPFEHRVVTKDTVKRLGGNVLDLPKDLLAKVEALRTSPQRQKLDRKETQAWAQEQIKALLDDPEKQKPLIGPILERLMAGDKAMSLELLNRLAGIQGRRFDSQKALDDWFEQNGIGEDDRKTILKRVDTADNAAHDRILCFDLATGKTAWQMRAEGAHRGWGTSSTPCIRDGRLYVAGSAGAVYCRDAAGGAEIWTVNVGNVEINSSVAVADGKVLVLAGDLVALNAADGKELWRVKEIKERESSPALWSKGGKTYALVNSGGKLWCVDIADGSVAWSADGAGGKATPAVDGDLAVVLTDKKETGLAAFRLSPSKAERIWTVAEIADRGASAIAHGGLVYASTDGEVACVRGADGQVIWKQAAKGKAFSSPVLADGKLVTVKNFNIELYDASTDSGGKQLARARLGPLECTSPTVVDGKLLVRQGKAVACWQLPGR